MAIQHLQCDARLPSVCIIRGPRTGFRRIASFVKVCPGCWPKLEGYVYALDELQLRFFEIAVRRAIVILQEQDRRAVPLPATVAQRIERELLPTSDLFVDDEPRESDTIHLAPIGTEWPAQRYRQQRAPLVAPADYTRRAA